MERSKYSLGIRLMAALAFIMPFSCQELTVVPSVCPETFVDNRDNRTYRTFWVNVQNIQGLPSIQQCWMAENLNFGVVDLCKYEINNTGGGKSKCCLEDDATNCELYGGLYGWKNMMQGFQIDKVQGICPEGWHIPSDYEWKLLEIAVSNNNGLSVDINKLCAEGHDRGLAIGLELKGISGFGVLVEAGNYVWREQEGSFIENESIFWTSSSSESNHAVGREFRVTSFFEDLVIKGIYTKNSHAHSVRCIKD